MKALTICQPYSELIRLGQKRVENRTWWTHYRGPLVIHAGKSREWLEPGDLRRYPDMVFGAVVAVADMVACLPYDAIERGRVPEAFRWVETHAHTGGPVCWVFREVLPLAEPIPCRGAQGLWDLPGDVNDAVMSETLKAVRVLRESGSDVCMEIMCDG